MNIVQRLVAVSTATAAAGALVPAAHATADAPVPPVPTATATATAQVAGAQAAGALAANPCDAKNLRVIPVPKSKDPKVGLKMRLTKERGEGGGTDYWAEFVVTYCPNNVNPAHLKRPSQREVVLKFAVTRGKKRETVTCQRGQYFWRHAAWQRHAKKPKPMFQRCRIGLPNHKGTWKGSATLTYDVSTDKRKPYVFKVGNAVLK
ncbi:hypothetical protein SMC26_18085 [Actinomadura fulvescens]|uniref:Secreted protein n=1 Tax=Actinomadura fulvescens TaxID=46160 RepID=A0ABP6CBL9_9ACTN